MRHSSARPSRWQQPGAATALAIVAVLASAFAGVADVSGQTIQGRVIDARSGAGVPTASVTAATGGLVAAGALTNANGTFRIRLEAPGVYLVRVSREGYASVAMDSLRVLEGDTLTLPDIALEPGPIVLDELRVETPRRRPRGQERIRQRQLLGKGVFLSGAMISGDQPKSLTWYLAETAGLQVWYGRRGMDRYPSLRSPTGTYDCVRIQINHWSMGQLGYRSLDEIDLDMIAAVEIYPTFSEVPPENMLIWETNRRCGLVNVWLWNAW
jgi:hypothetical protein